MKHEEVLLHQPRSGCSMAVPSHSSPLSPLAAARRCLFSWRFAQLLMGKRGCGSAELILKQAQLSSALKTPELI